MHPRNRHQGRYDFEQLKKVLPDLGKFISKKFGNETIDFADPEAVRALNKALLKSFYRIEHWDIPPQFLCPPIPGRADYIHTIAELGGGRVLDIGTGANCIYPLIGNAEYGWKFVGSDVDAEAVKNAQKIVKENLLRSEIEIRLQSSSKNIFKNVIAATEKFDLTMCNPPFHASAEEAREGTERKWRNLGKKGSGLNFGGKSHELWCPGGEKAFVGLMIEESKLFGNQCKWFTTLVSKDENLTFFEKSLTKLSVSEIRILKMEQGQKKSRVLAWTFGKRQE